MNHTTRNEAIRKRLLQRRQELSHRGSRVNADLRREHEPLTPDFADQATQRENDDVLMAISESSAVEIGLVNQALERLASGEYGRCQRCGQEIAAARLEVVPHALYCASCAETAV